MPQSMETERIQTRACGQALGPLGPLTAGLPTEYELQGIYSCLLYNVRAARVYRWYLLHGRMKSSG